MHDDETSADDGLHMAFARTVGEDTGAWAWQQDVRDFAERCADFSDKILGGRGFGKLQMIFFGVFGAAPADYAGLCRAFKLKPDCDVTENIGKIAYIARANGEEEAAVKMDRYVAIRAAWRESLAAGHRDWSARARAFMAPRAPE